MLSDRFISKAETPTEHGRLDFDVELQDLLSDCIHLTCITVVVVLGGTYNKIHVLTISS